MTRLRRTRREKLPPGCMVVTRPTRWGNLHNWQALGRAEAVRRFAADLAALSAADREAYLAPLRGATALACWCPLDGPCHGDVLIEWLRTPAR